MMAVSKPHRIADYGLKIAGFRARQGRVNSTWGTFDFQPSIFNRRVGRVEESAIFNLQSAMSATSKGIS
jgi:hypothetical protein